MLRYFEVPEPQPDHAQRISKFAGECMSKMKEVVAILDDELGGTASLSFRVGLHSGCVTVRDSYWRVI